MKKLDKRNNLDYNAGRNICLIQKDIGFQLGVGKRLGLKSEGIQGESWGFALI